jgi:hypothetical protein
METEQLGRGGGVGDGVEAGAGTVGAECCGVDWRVAVFPTKQGWCLAATAPTEVLRRRFLLSSSACRTPIWPLLGSDDEPLWLPLLASEVSRTADDILGAPRE